VHGLDIARKWAFYSGLAKRGSARVSVIGWILFGLITGFVASRIVSRRGQGCILNIALGIIGALVGGFVFTRIGGHGVNGFTLYSMFVAIIGAIVVLLIYHTVAGNRPLR
jgi:uncharacterized membrane protein YeaQ/YmgE (transglycosylase-associated protein family)